MKVVAYIGLLILPLMVGSILKLALIDVVPEDTALIKEHIYSGYIQPLWIEFLVLLFVVVISWTSSTDFAAAKQEDDFQNTMLKLLGVVAFSLVVCIVLAIGLPRWELHSFMITVVAPAAVALAALSFSVQSIKS